MKLLSAVDIVKEVVEGICPVINIDSWSYDTKKKQFTIESCDTYYLTPCKTIIIEEKVFEVLPEGFIQDTSFIIKQVLKFENSDVLEEITVESFDLYKLHFFHGSPINVNNDLSKIQFGFDKFPCVYLWETLREKHFVKSSGSPISFEFDAKLVFLDSAKWDSWTSDQHKSKVIDPMKASVNSFVKAIDKNRKCFALLEDFTTVPRANFGVYQKEQGVMSSYFNDMTSGVESIINFKYKKFPCKIKC